MPYSTGCFQCRNMAQKQWDETLVLVLGGIARILRLFFPFFSSLSNFWSDGFTIKRSCIWYFYLV
ncbi:hypothetical protein JHK87_012166 [Glycine soja]|nr:hypothetical protein JHK87_012166 [Glycine soja]